MVVTFFGHRDAPASVESPLTETLVDLIENRGATLFYVGNNGEFDRIVQNKLTVLQHQYPCIQICVVLAYLPGERNDNKALLNTVYPEGLELVPKRFAICRRNEWMIAQSDLVVTYVKRSFGGAARYAAIAEKRGKPIINIAEHPYYPE